MALGEEDSSDGEDARWFLIIVLWFYIVLLYNLSKLFGCVGVCKFALRKLLWFKIYTVERNLV